MGWSTICRHTETVVFADYIFARCIVTIKVERFSYSLQMETHFKTVKSIGNATSVSQEHKSFLSQLEIQKSPKVMNIQLHTLVLNHHHIASADGAPLTKHSMKERCYGSLIWVPQQCIKQLNYRDIQYILIILSKTSSTHE